MSLEEEVAALRMEVEALWAEIEAIRNPPHRVSYIEHSWCCPAHQEQYGVAGVSK